MTVPAPSRKAGIIDKLNYAESQRHELDRALYGTYRNGDPLPQFVAHRAADILSHARECFDHLGMDLLEQHLLPNASAKFQKAYAAGSVKNYFPFYAGQLQAGKFGFDQLESINRPLYDELKGFVAAIDAKKFIVNTTFRLSWFRTIQEMVNEKKHVRVLEYVAAHRGVRYTAGKSNGIDLEILHNAAPSNPPIQVVVEGQNISKPVPSFRFTNGLDVNELSLFAVHATRKVMDLFYDKYFAPTDQRVEPAETVAVSVDNSGPGAAVTLAFDAARADR